MPEFARWRKSTRSNDNSNCVEVGGAPSAVGIRDTTDRDYATLAVSRRSWRRFLRAVRAGALDRHP